jgi:hypothetical protein
MVRRIYQPNSILLSTTNINPLITNIIIKNQKTSHNEKQIRLLKKEKNFAIEGYIPFE